MVSSHPFPHLSHSSLLSSLLYMHIPSFPHLFLLLHLFLSYHSSYSFLVLIFLSFSKAMNQFKKSQVLVLFVLVILLVITPSLPSSLRPTYLYFIINFLIIALCAEAGLISDFAKPLEDRKQSSSVTVKPMMPSEATSDKREASNFTPKIVSAVSEDVERERVVCVTKVDKVQKSPSVPSLFFIEADHEEVMDEEVEAEEEVGGVNGQELFAKAEAFIGDFYKQLKMQSEESWIY